MKGGQGYERKGKLRARGEEDGREGETMKVRKEGYSTGTSAGKGGGGMDGKAGEAVTV